MRRFAALLALLLACSPVQALTNRQLDNLEAFTRLLSLVRFFHPSDAVAGADWNRVAVAGVSSVRDAVDPRELADRLEDFFRPWAPTLQVWPAGERPPEMPPELRPPSSDARIVAWRHYGGHFDSDLKLFSSERIDDHDPPGYGTLAQAVLVPDSLKARRVRLRAWIRAEMVDDGRVQLGLRVDRAGGKTGFFDNMADRPIHSTPWKIFEIEGDVAPDAERILVMVVVTGGGRVWLDEVSLAAVGGGGGSVLLNTGFDDGGVGEQPPNWLFPYESVRAGYHVVVRRGDKCWRGDCPNSSTDPRILRSVQNCVAGSCAEISSDPIATPRFVRPDQVLETALGAGVTAWLPVALYADAQGTLPHTPAPRLDVDARADTPDARIAAAALAWGIFQHFHPELRMDDPSWRAALRPALAAADTDREAFLRAFRSLLAPLHDSRANVVPPGGRPYAALPLAWEVVEGRLVVTSVADGTQGVRPGDIVDAIDGRPVLEVLAAEETLSSAGTQEADRWQALESLLWGPKGSRVTLRLQSGSEIELTRETPYEKLPAGTPLAALPPITEPRPGVLYIDLGRIEEEDLEAMTQRLAAAKGLIFDLRRGRNVSTVLLSHLIDKTAASSKWQVPVVMAPDHRDVEWMTTFWTIEPKAPRFRGRVAFLADGRCDGYAETLLAMIEAYRMGDIVGARSGGSNGSLNQARLPGGWRVTWSGQRVLKHDDSPLQGVGVAPTFPAARTLRGITDGRDEVVERALAVVSR